MRHPRSRSIRAIGAAVSGLIVRHAIVALIVLFVVGATAMVWTHWHSSMQLMRSGAIQGTAAYADAMNAFRTVYTSEVVSRLEGRDIEVTHEYAHKPGAIPLPITLSLVLAQRLGEEGTGLRVEIYSDFPFPSRIDGGPHDEFEREALRALRKHPDEPFYRFEELDGQEVLRYATADLMRPSCVPCHNHHPDSPKRDWKVGDVRGVLEVIRPVDQIAAETAATSRSAALLLAALGAIGLCALALVITKLRSSSREAASRAADAERAAATRDEVLGTVAHDLRNPLGAIGLREMVIEELCRGHTQEDAIRDNAEAIGRSARHMERLIEDLLDLAQLQAGRLRIERALQGPAAIVERALDALRPLARDAGVTLDTAVAPELPQVSCDDDRIQQVFGNLVRNALQATPAGGTITLSVELCERSLRFGVADTGSGIAEADLARMFERYWRGAEATVGGTGRGLAIAQGIVDAHGGSIWAESTVGKGTKISFTLPIAGA